MINYHTQWYRNLSQERKRKRRERITISNRARSKRHKNMLIEYLGGKCQKCGYNENILALQFHHLRDKETEISNMIRMGYSYSKILEEAKKCQLLCANCHLIITFTPL